MVQADFKLDTWCGLCDIFAACSGTILAFTIERKVTVCPPPVDVALVLLQRPLKPPVSLVQFFKVSIYEQPPVTVPPTTEAPPQPEGKSAMNSVNE